MEAANIHIDPRFSGRGPFKDTATVKIVVEDADEPPVFSSPTYLLEVHENAALNSVIGQVTARDPDVTSSPIRYFSFTCSTVMKGFLSLYPLSVCGWCVDSYICLLRATENAYKQEYQNKSSYSSSWESYMEMQNCRHFIVLWDGSFSFYALLFFSIAWALPVVFVSSDRYSELYIRIQRYETIMSPHLEVPILFLNVGLKSPSSQFVSILISQHLWAGFFYRKTNISVSFENTSCL